MQRLDSFRDCTFNLSLRKGAAIEKSFGENGSSQMISFKEIIDQVNIWSQSCISFSEPKFEIVHVEEDIQKDEEDIRKQMVTIIPDEANPLNGNVKIDLELGEKVYYIINRWYETGFKF